MYKSCLIMSAFKNRVVNLANSTRASEKQLKSTRSYRIASSLSLGPYNYPTSS